MPSRDFILRLIGKDFFAATASSKRAETTI